MKNFNYLLLGIVVIFFLGCSSITSKKGDEEENNNQKALGKFGPQDLIISKETTTYSEKKGDREVFGLKTDFVKPEGVSFAVDDVKIADSLLKVDYAKYIFENKIGKEILFYPEETANLGLVNSRNNGLIQTIQECYDNHRPLVLTPDIIWLTICQGVSIHINENYDSLKSIIFIEDKPDEIIVRNDSLDYGAKHWKSLLESFAVETKKYTNDDFYSFFVSEFSTTTAIDKTAYQITLLESYKKAFQYIGDTGCGIPSILIAGNQEDWETILEKLDMLDKIGLSNWANSLKPVINEFINASKGNQNTEFWQSIYKSASEYAAFYISGWIIKFFPYIKELEQGGVFDEEHGATKIGEVYTLNRFIDDDNYLLSTLSTDNFPSGIAKVPVIWNNHFTGETKNIEVYAGFFAIKQYPDKSLEPFVSWAICDEKAEASHHELSINRYLDLEHHSDYWSPHFAKKVTDPAIYDIKKFKSQSSSLDYIRSVVIESLSNNMDFNKDDYLNDTIQIQVLSNGKTAKVTLLKSKNEQLTDYISGIIKGLPEQWFPALAHPGDVLELWDLPKEEADLKVRSNSIVKIGL